MAHRSTNEPPPVGVDQDNEPLLEASRNVDHTQRKVPALDGEVEASEAMPVHTDPTRRSGEEPRLSSESQETDLELDSMRHEDPLYRNGSADVRERSTWTATKQGNWIDTGQDESMLDAADREKEARRLGNKQFVKKNIINAILIGLWYILSIAMSVYNKWMFSPGNLDFHFPLFSTSVHMLVQFGLASLVLYLLPQFRPSQGAVAAVEQPDPEDVPRQRPPPKDSSKPLMTPWFYLTRIASCGAVTGLDIGLGNTSLKFISLTFFTMVKSSTLGFVLGFAILFRLEAPSWKIGGIIAVMTLGVILMVSGETAFNAIGFALLMGASFFSGLRWSLTQILLRRTPATSNPFSTLFFLTPVMFAVLFLLAIPVETFPALGEGLDTLAKQKGLPLGMAIVLFPGCIAFCMTSAEFALLKRTSVVTLSVCGIFKEVLTITAAGIIFGDELTPINISGLLITIAAIAVYNWTRMRKMKRMEISKARDGGSAAQNNAAGAASAGLAQQEGSGARSTAQAFGGSGEVYTHKTKDSEMSEGTAVADEQAPMLPPSSGVHRRSPVQGHEGDDAEDDDDEDVVMIQGREDESQSKLEPMREPVRALFKKNRHDGYAAL